MSFIDLLAGAERANDSLLCVGLDPDPARFPARCAATPRASSSSAPRIVDATKDLVIAFKPQIAYFAAHRAEDAARAADRAHPRHARRTCR